MIRINQIKKSLDSHETELLSDCAKRLGVKNEDIKSLRVFRKSVDSRKKDNVFFVYSVDVELKDSEDAVIAAIGENADIFKVEIPKYVLPENKRVSNFRPVIVGFGPAGFFAGLTLARSGLKPLILERGADVDKRTADVDRFWKMRQLDEESNVQFGEGGAGTFSDGKLNTGIKDPFCRHVLEEFAAHGAPEEILYSAKPHIGTDKLKNVVKNIREEIISLGGEVIFNAKLSDIIVFNGVIQGITYEKNGSSFDFETDTLVLCIGHSARDTVKMLYSHGINMMKKPFSVGARIEHPREFIDKAQYGKFAGHPALGAADYKMACHPPHGRGAYTFCMCPGGTVVAAASEKGGVVVNGMSEYNRDAENSNSALLVGIDPEEFPGDSPLSGFDLQRDIESKAFSVAGSDYSAPCQLVGDFLSDKASTRLGSVNPSCPTGVTPTDLRKVLPKKVTDTLSSALVQMDKKLHGFTLPVAVLTGAETRSSSPVRILRDDLYQTNVRGLFPAGEGAGYAGGIVSAAVDGIRCAHAVLEDER